MKSYFEILKRHIKQNPPNFGEADSVLEMLYDCHNERNPYDNDQIKADFKQLFSQTDTNFNSLNKTRTLVVTAEGADCVDHLVHFPQWHAIHLLVQRIEGSYHQVYLSV